MPKKTEETWGRIRKDYEDGLYDMAELASVNGISAETVKKKAAVQQWKRPENDRTVRRLKNQRVQMLDAICSSTMEGLKKADDLLAECDSLRDVELHSKTVKNYRDICIGRSQEDILEDTSDSSIASQLDNKLDGLLADRVQAVLDES